MKMFVAYDSKVEKYMEPFFCPNTKSAIRAIETAVQDSKTNFNRYPSDFTFFEVGEFNEVTGEFVKLNTLHSLGLAQDFMRAAPIAAQ